MVTRPEQRVQRGHHYAIADEVDSILIDEARTPLIISGAGTKSASTYKDFARAVRGLERGEDVSHDMLTATEDAEPTGDFVMDEAKHTIAATERGLKKIERRLGIEDIYADLSGPARQPPAAGAEGPVHVPSRQAVRGHQRRGQDR